MSNAIDMTLVKILREEPRATNSSIAAKLGVSAATAASKIQKHAYAKQLRILPEVSMGAAGFGLFVSVGIEVSGRHPELVASDLADVPEVHAIHSVSGRFELLATFWAKDNLDLLRLTNESIGTVAGVQAVETFLVASVERWPEDIGLLERVPDRPIPRAASATRTLDDLDWQILDALAEDGRTSIRDVARKTDAPETTIRSRIARFTESNEVNFRAVTSTTLLGESSFPSLAVLAIRARPGEVANVVKLLRSLDGVAAISMIVSGGFHVLATLSASTRRDLHHVVFDRISTSSSVQHLESWEVVETFLLDPRMAPTALIANP